MEVKKLIEDLAALFPQFEQEWREDTDGDTWDHTLHSVWMSFAPLCQNYLEAAPNKTRDQFCQLVNEQVAAGGGYENAVSTCLLEHASQLGVRKLIQSHLSEDAKRELR